MRSGRRTSNVLFLVAGILLGVAVVVTFSMLYLPGAYMSMGDAQQMVPVFMVTQTLTTFIPPVAAALIALAVVLRALTVREQLRRTIALILTLAGVALLALAIVLIVIGPNLAIWAFPSQPFASMITERVAAILRQVLPAVAAATLIAGTVLMLLQPKPEATQATPAA